MALRDRIKDYIEGIASFEACGIDGSARVGFGLSCPHGPITVCDFTLDHTGPEFALGSIIGWLNLAWIVAKGKKLILSSSDFVLQLFGKMAERCSVKKARELFFQLPSFAGKRCWREIGSGFRQRETPVESELEAKRQIV